MAVEDPVTHVRKLVNVPADNPPRLEASNFAVYSDAVNPVTTAIVDPPPNANGWNQAPVSVSLDATDLASGLNDTPAGWVDQLRYSLAGAQTGAETVVPGHSASFGVAPQGVTTISYFATDAAGNEETARTLDVKIDGVPPVLSGLPAEGCTLWPPNHKLQRVAVLRASDAVSGIARGSFQVNATSNEPMDPSDVSRHRGRERRTGRRAACRAVGWQQVRPRLSPDGHGAGPGRQRGDRDGHLHRPARQRGSSGLDQLPSRWLVVQDAGNQIAAGVAADRRLSGPISHSMIPRLKTSLCASTFNPERLFGPISIA